MRLVKKETPRQRIKRLNKQLDRLSEKYDVNTEINLCSFCKEFWSSGPYEGEYDWGCNADPQGYNKKIDSGKQVLFCRDFKPLRNYEVRCEGILVEALNNVMDKLNPYYKDIKALEATIIDLRSQNQLALSNLMTTRKQLDLEYANQKFRLEKLIPAEVLAELIKNEVKEVKAI